jgi:hypothetical protein
MKNIFRLLIIVCLLASTGAASGQMNPGVLLLDSVYSYNWVTNNWSLNIENYLIKNGSGQTTQSLFKQYDTGTGQFLDFERFLFTYSGTFSAPSAITDQLWYFDNWNTYQFTHYLTKNIIDTSYYKRWDNQHHRFTTGLRNTYQYNDSLLPAENITQSWDTTTQDWFNTTRTTYSYTAVMKLSEQIIFWWQSSTATWENIIKYANVYDVNNLLVSHLEYDWNDSAANWINMVRTSYYYNLTSMPNLAVKEVWNSSLNAWDSVEQTTYIYNQLNWLMTILSQNYQQDQGKWVNDSLTYYTYSTSGVQQSMTGDIWNTINLSWATDVYQILDSASQKVAETYNLYIDQGNFLITGGIRNLYTYSSKGDTLTWVNQVWNVPNSGWANKSQVLYTYDSHNLLVEELEQNWTSASSSWVNATKFDYFYSEFIGIGEHPAKEKPCFYANPMVEGNSIYCPDFKAGDEYLLRVCSLSGIEVYRTDFRGGEAVIISKSLAPGLYFLIIEENDNILYQDKIVILR